MIKYLRLGDMLVSGGVISDSQLKDALVLQKETGKRLGDVLIDNNFITEQQLIDVLQIQLGVEYIDLTLTNIPPEMAKILPRSIARRNVVVPVKVIRDELHLAMVDPLNFIAVEEVRAATKLRVIPMIARADAMRHAIASLYGGEVANRAIEEMTTAVTAEKQQPAESDVVVIGDDETSGAAPTVRLVNTVLERAVLERASDIHLEPRADEMVVRLRVDGFLRTVLAIPNESQNSVISRIKVMGGMDVANRRIPQDGRANIRVHNADVDLRISTIPTIYGEKVTIRLLGKNAGIFTVDDIGLEGNNLIKFKNLIDTNRNGIILIVGPTGSGKSASMSMMVSMLNRDEVNIVTLEDPVEYNIDGVNQVQINERAGVTFASGLRSILRQDPDIIAVGEIRDSETVSIALRAAATGHLVLSTIHTNNAVSTIARLIDIGAEAYLVADTLRGVISQRLLRRICTKCRCEYIPDTEEEILMGIPEHEHGKYKFYRAAGCPDCFHTGYRGRVAAFEILTVNSAVASAIRRHEDAEHMRAAIEDTDFEPLEQNCRRLVLNGITTLEEALRIVRIGE